jgi:hypothetical protein
VRRLVSEANSPKAFFAAIIKRDKAYFIGSTFNFSFNESTSGNRE